LAGFWLLIAQTSQIVSGHLLHESNLLDPVSHLLTIIDESVAECLFLFQIGIALFPPFAGELNAILVDNGNGATTRQSKGAKKPSVTPSQPWHGLR
jgi:hypothetical protein